MKRTVVAFLLTPLVPALILAHDVGILLAVVLSYFWTFLLGLPGFFVLRRMKKESHGCYAATGFAIGFLAAFVQGRFDASSLRGAAIFGFVGFAAALSFSMIRGDERKMPNQPPEPTAPSGRGSS